MRFSMIVAINYANRKFRAAQKFNTKSAYQFGAQKVIEYTPRAIDKNFREKNKKILSHKRGNGYWLWKPYLIYKTLASLHDNDYLVYVDSGAAYINHVDNLISSLEESKQSIMLFQISQIEKYYTKRNAFILMDCDNEYYYNSHQICGTYSIYKKNNESMAFVKKWLDYAQDPDLIMDDPAAHSTQEFDCFVDHRHDQSILSLLAKKEGIIPFRNPSQYGTGNEYDPQTLVISHYPQMFNTHRNPDIGKSRLSRKIGRIINKIFP